METYDHLLLQGQRRHPWLIRCGGGSRSNIAHTRHMDSFNGRMFQTVLKLVRDRRIKRGHELTWVRMDQTSQNIEDKQAQLFSLSLRLKSYVEHDL